MKKSVDPKTHISESDLKWALGTSDGRKMLAKASPAFVATNYLDLDAPMHHRGWYDKIKSAERLLLVAPRDHGKTFVMRVYSVWKIINNRNVRILYIGETDKVARKRVMQIRFDLEKNQKIISDYGRFAPHQNEPEKWLDNELYVTGRTSNNIDPTVEGVGVGGAITGGHFDLIVLDDPVSPKTVAQQGEREKTEDWFYRTVAPMLAPNGQIVVIGTLKHYDDLYASLRRNKRFRTSMDAAISAWPDSYEIEEAIDPKTGEELYGDVVIHGEYDRVGSVLWPERWSIEDLLIRHAEKPRAFRMEMQHEIVSDDEAAFPPALFTGGKVMGKYVPGCIANDEKLIFRPSDMDRGPYENPHGYHILQAWDLALVDDKNRAQRNDSDFTVGITCGFDPSNGERHLLSIVRKRGIMPGEIQSLIKQEAMRFRAGQPGGVKFIAIENNNFGRLHHLEIQRSTDLPIVPHMTTKKKADIYEGIPAMWTIFERGKWKFPHGDDYSRDMSEIVQAEFIGLGKERHDDTVMAFWILESLLSRYKLIVSRGYGAQDRAEGRKRKPKLERPQHSAARG